MKLKVLGSGSSGNGYLLVADNGETLIIEAGISASNVFKEVKYENIAGLIISHSHGDHAGYINDYLGKSIDTYISNSCFECLKIEKRPTLKLFQTEKQFKVGSFNIKPFLLDHDVPCHGFLIGHEECGNILFCTDTKSINYKFPGVETLMIESDFDYNILIRNKKAEIISDYLANRIMQTHMSIDDAINFAENYKKSLGSIILLHLSKSNANGEIFKNQMQSNTGINTHIAEQGLEVKLGLPF